MEEVSFYLLKVNCSNSPVGRAPYHLFKYFPSSGILPFLSHIKSFPLYSESFLPVLNMF